MLQGIPLRAESPRYNASLVVLPELWAPASSWQAVAGFLGHRGWEGWVLELRGQGGLEDRAAAVVEFAARLDRPPVLVGHGVGAHLALRTAQAARAAALVLIAPVEPGSAPSRGLVSRWDVAKAALLRGDVPPPQGRRAARLFGETPSRLGAEPAPAVLDLVRSTPPPGGPPGVPTLLVAGSRDPLLPPAAALALSQRLDAERADVVDAGHWLHLRPDWQRTVGLVHRWLVQRLGEGLLDYYADAMAERGGDGTD